MLIRDYRRYVYRVLEKFIDKLYSVYKNSVYKKTLHIFFYLMETNVPSLYPVVENVTYDAFEAPRVLMQTQKEDRIDREFSLYVRGVVNGMSKSVLEKEFSTFGFVKNLDVVPSKSCAFVEFSTQEACQQALSYERIEIPNFGYVTVEERKQKTQKTRQTRQTHRHRHNNRSTFTNQEISPVGTPSSSKHSNLAASDSQKWNITQLAEHFATKKKVGPQLMMTQSQPSDNHDHREFSLYVRGIVEGMNKSVIGKAFSAFGFVKNLDIVPSKSCAFVEFSTQEAYQQALSHKRIEIKNFGHVTVEERKQKTNRHRYYNRSTHTNQEISSTIPSSSKQHSTRANLAASDSHNPSYSQYSYASSEFSDSEPPQKRFYQHSSNYFPGSETPPPPLPPPRNQQAHKGRFASREFSLYVRGIVEGMNKPVLEKAFSSFGFVKNLDIVPSKSCAFVDFSTQKAYNQALSQKRIEIQNFGHVTVEERKPKNNNARSR